MFKLITTLLGLFVLTSTGLAQEVPEVRVSTLAEIANYPLRSAPASVHSLNEAIISAEISARVLDIPVRVGDVVQKGSDLVILDCTNYELALNQSVAALEALKIRAELAAKKLQRTRSLRQNDSISAESLDERTADLAVMQADIISAEAARGRARADQDRCTVVSPLMAVIVERISAVGQFAGPGTALIKLIDIGDIEVSAQVSTELIEQIQATRELYFSHAGKRFPVSIRSILPVINPETRNQQIRFLFTDKRAITGAAGKLFWVDNRPHITADLLVERDGNLGIFIEDDGIARLHVIAGAQPGRSTPVNLANHTRIIIDGHYSLRDKTKIRIVE
jgi:RND family efflux transporter MFP subunit